jgi:hypothetical protein
MTATARFGAALSAAMLAWPAAVTAQSAPSTEDGRYSLYKTADGYLRLDARNGEVSICSQRTVGWACAVAPDDRAVLESENARLRAENGMLKKELLSRGLTLPPGARPEAQPASGGQTGAEPHPELDQMLAAVDRAWRRLIEAIAEARRQMRERWAPDRG